MLGVEGEFVRRVDDSLQALAVYRQCFAEWGVCDGFSEWRFERLLDHIAFPWLRR